MYRNLAAAILFWAGTMSPNAYAVVLGQVDNAEAAREVARRVVESLCQPIPLDGGHVAHIGASVGMAMCCTDNTKETLDDLLKKADTALYAAKREGKNTFREADTSVA